MKWRFRERYENTKGTSESWWRPYIFNIARTIAAILFILNYVHDDTGSIKKNTLHITNVLYVTQRIFCTRACPLIIRINRLCTDLRDISIFGHKDHTSCQDLATKPHTVGWLEPDRDYLILTSEMSKLSVTT